MDTLFISLYKLAVSVVYVEIHFFVLIPEHEGTVAEQVKDEGLLLM